MRIKMNYFNDNIIVNLFNSLLPDNYFIYITACAGVGCNSFSNELEYFIPVRFCRKHKGVMKCIDGHVHASVRLHNKFIELQWMRLNIDVLQWEGESDPLHLDVKFSEFRDFDALKRAVSYDAKCLSKGCPTVTIGVKDIEYEE